MKKIKQVGKLAAVCCALFLGIFATACGSGASGKEALTAASDEAPVTEEASAETPAKAPEEPEKKLTAEELAGQTIQKMSEVREVSQSVTLDLKATIDSGEESAELSMGMELAIDLNQEPLVTHTNGTVRLSVLGQDQETKIEMYSVEEDGKYNLYTSDGTTWTGTQADIPKDSSLYSRTVYEAIADGGTDAVLEDETKTVNGKDAYVIRVTLTGEFLQDALQQVNSALNNMSDNNMDLGEASAPAELYIYEDSLYPAGLDVDAEELGNAMIRSAVGETDEDVSFTIGIFHISTILDRFNEVGAIQIPEEVMSAVSAAGQSAEDADLGDAKWQDMVLSMDGQIYQLPFPYSKLRDSWSFDLADYGYADGYVLNPGDKVTGTITLDNDRYDKVRFNIGFMNTGDKVQDILDTDVWSFTMDISSADKYPEVMLPDGITWGSTSEDILKAYGEPEEEPFVSKELGYTVYNWFDDFTYKLKLTVYDDGGLKAISLENYEH
ncbi:DUF6612 family protein [Lachnoclostridium sp. Marseille-P6806]|uniref:DUF6612 family protein n=1 Tax=Lachnoclostridium sp. Marseille-P6806 TaxID=2364793 RepID=UPI0010324336|nr:DUF6612 family protein [Lachnoclostridium sp. Marseille-P6806]